MKKEPITIAVDFDGSVTSHEFPKVGKDIGAVLPTIIIKLQI